MDPNSVIKTEFEQILMYMQPLVDFISTDSPGYTSRNKILCVFGNPDNLAMPFTGSGKKKRMGMWLEGKLPAAKGGRKKASKCTKVTALKCGVNALFDSDAPNNKYRFVDVAGKLVSLNCKGVWELFCGLMKPCIAKMEAAKLDKDAQYEATKYFFRAIVNGGIIEERKINLLQAGSNLINPTTEKAEYFGKQDVALMDILYMSPAYISSLSLAKQSLANLLRALEKHQDSRDEGMKKLCTAIRRQIQIRFNGGAELIIEKEGYVERMKIARALHQASGMRWTPCFGPDLVRTLHWVGMHSTEYPMDVLIRSELPANVDGFTMSPEDSALITYLAQSNMCYAPTDLFNKKTREDIQYERGLTTPNQGGYDMSQYGIFASTRNSNTGLGGQNTGIHPLNRRNCSDDVRTGAEAYLRKNADVRAVGLTAMIESFGNRIDENEKVPMLLLKGKVVEKESKWEVFFFTTTPEGRKLAEARANKNKQAGKRKGKGKKKKKSSHKKSKRDDDVSSSEEEDLAITEDEEESDDGKENDAQEDVQMGDGGHSHHPEHTYAQKMDSATKWLRIHFKNNEIAASPWTFLNGKLMKIPVNANIVQTWPPVPTSGAGMFLHPGKFNIAGAGAKLHNHVGAINYMVREINHDAVEILVQTEYVFVRFTQTSMNDTITNFVQLRDGEVTTKIDELNEQARLHMETVLSEHPKVPKEQEGKVYIKYIAGRLGVETSVFTAGTTLTSTISKAQDRVKREIRRPIQASMMEVVMNNLTTPLQDHFDDNSLPYHTADY